MFKRLTKNIGGRGGGGVSPEVTDLENKNKNFTDLSPMAQEELERF